MMNTIIKKFPFFNTNSGLLVLRIGVGAIFITTGWMKISNIGMTLGTFAALGFSSFWVYLVIAIELLGGIAILLGIYTRPAAVLLAIIMIVATFTVHSDITITLAPVALLFSTLSLLLAGSGKYSPMQESPAV